MMKGLFALAAAGCLAVVGSLGPISPTQASIGSATTDTVPPGRAFAWGGLGWDSVNVVPIVAQSGVTAIAAGNTHTLALRDGAVAAWGSNGSRETTVPTLAKSGVTAIAAAFESSLAVSVGRVIAWGSNSNGQRDVPVEAESSVTDVAAGGLHGLALREGRVLAWGYEGVYSEGPTPVDVPPEALSGVDAIAAGWCHSMALKEGRVLSWGQCMYSESGHPVPVDALSGVTAIAAGRNHALALKGDRVIAWGSNHNVFGDYVGQAVVPAEAISGVIAISAGMYFSVALKQDGRIIVWGDDRYRQARVPEELQGRATAISAGGWHVAAIRSFTPPSSPVAVKAVGGNGDAEVTWAAPSDDGGTSITGYTVTAAPSGASCTTITLRCSITGLSNGTPYTITVTATNSAGTSLPSTGATVTPRTVSDSPTNVTVTAGNAQATVTWQAPASDGGSPITGYSAVASPGSATCRTVSLTCVITGLSNGTRYTITVTATNLSGASAPSIGVQVTPQSPVVAPGPPGSLMVTPLRGAIRVAWSAPADLGGATRVTYQYQVGKQAWKPTSKTRITIKGKKGTRIPVQVRAVNSAGPGKALKVVGIPK